MEKSIRFGKRAALGFFALALSMCVAASFSTAQAFASYENAGFNSTSVSSESVKTLSGNGIKLAAYTYYVGMDDSPIFSFSSDAAVENANNAKVVKVTSSNSKVLKVVKRGKSLWGIELIAKKAGKSKVTIKYKLNGKTYKTSRTYKVQEYPNAIESMTLNGKSIDLTKKANKFHYSNYNYKKSKAKVKFNLASNWGISYIYCNSWKNSGSQPKGKRVKNGATFKVPSKGGASLSACFVDSNGKRFEYYVTLSRR